MRVNGVIFILLAAAVGLAACSSPKSAIVKRDEVGVGSSQKSPILKRDEVGQYSKRPPQVSPVRRKVLSLLEKKNYRQAVELMKGKNHEGLERELVLAVNGLLGVGHDTFSLGDYAAAARAFKGVLEVYPVEPSVRKLVSLDPKRIRSILETCAHRMMELGIEEYRRGKLENAIGKWKVVLAISPGHQEAKRSIDTATVQLQALQNM